ncbi:MAG: lipid A-modifier LpxR family protein [Pseudomonadota bacterium]
MHRLLLLALAITCQLCVPAAAQDRVLLGYGALITNDFLGDGRDRWQTGSIQGSRVWGPEGGVPSAPFTLLELRLGGQSIAPARLRNPAPGDRRYAGALSAGLHTHWLRGDAEFSLGGDLVFVGPNTGLDGLHAGFHDFLNITQPSDTVRANQIGNAVRPTLVAEAAHNFGLGAVALRPFAEVRAGAETLLRAGADLSFGGLGQAGLRVRDTVTGQRYAAVHAKGAGTRWILGGDIAYVGSSVFLPTDTGPAPENTRTRLRAGVQWQTQSGARGFYGLTWLSEEFEDQPEGQLTGSFNLRVQF